MAICKQVCAEVFALSGKEDIGIIDVEEAAPLGVVVARLQIVQPCGIVVVIPAIGERAEDCYDLPFLLGQVFTVMCNRHLAPRVIAVFEQGCTLLIDDSYDIPLQVAHKRQRHFIVHKAADGRVAFVIDKFRRERKLDDLFRTIERHIEIVRHALVGQKLILPDIVDIVLRFAVRFVLPLLCADLPLRLFVMF